MEKIDHIVYINLDRRTDRKQEINNEFALMGINQDKIERFQAIPTCPGIVGCGLSHMGVLELAKNKQYEHVLIMEDDFEFLVDLKQLEIQLNYLFTEFKLPWDVIMLSYNLRESEDIGDAVLGRVLKAQTASGYLVKRHYYQTLLDTLKPNIELLRITGEHWIYCNDVCWFPLQLKDNWFYFKNRIGRQRESVADNGYEPTPTKVICGF